MNVSKIILIAIAALIAGIVTAQDVNEQLFEAARKGDAAQVKSLLDRGIDVNAKSRYGATALSFACGKGHLDVVRLLIERGAQIDIKDSFYEATPISWAGFNDHLEVVKFMLQKGANGDEILMLGIERKKLEIVRMALENSKFSAETLTQALEAAVTTNDSGIIQALEKAGAVRQQQKQTVKVAPEILQSYAGRYRNPEGNELTLTAQENSLKESFQGQEFTLVPEDEKNFSIVELAGYKVEFQPEDGKVNRFLVTRPDGSTSVYTRMDESQIAAAEKESQPTHKVVQPENAKVAKAINWPSFRGAGGSGVADGQFPPQEWDVEKGTHIAWKTPIPGLAHSSPVIWGDRVFITTAISSDPESKLRHGLYGDVEPSEDLSKHTWRIYSLDKKSGKILWEKSAFEGAPNVKRHPKSTQANSTPATDGKHVVALFGYGGLHCYDFNGNLVWKRDLGVLDAGWFYDPDYQWAYGSSPVIYQDLVIVQADLQKNSYIGAFNLKNGQPVWKTVRDEIPSWGTPTIVQTKNGTQVVTNGTKFVRGYDAKTGKEIWRLGGNSEITVPTPFVAHDLIFVTSGYRPIQPIYAIKMNASGDITLKEDAETNEYIAWSKKRGGPYMPTPLVYGEYLYTCANNGVVTAYNAKTGERIYQKRLGGQGSGYAFTASPVAADGKLYFTSEDGEIYVVKAGPEYELLSVNKMNEVAMATPAISDGMIIIRTVGHVYGIKGK